MRDRISSAWKRVKQYSKETYDTITIEPNVFLHIFTFGIILGAAVQTNVVLWKICHVIKGHPEELCDDMVYEGGNHSEIKKDVQAYLNDFELYMDFIQAGPAVIYSLFAGALSDRHGSRRPLMLGPMIGWTLSFIIHVVHFAYIREAPLWLFYAYCLRWVMGGQALYYQGTYLYVADITPPEQKTTRFARMDGVVILAYMLGLFASPYIYNLGGYYLSCGLTIAMNVGALIHMIFFVKDFKISENETKKDENQNSKPRNEDQDDTHEPFLKKYLWTPLKESCVTLTKKRPGDLRLLLYVALVTYGIFYGTTSYGNQVYLYLTLVFEGFDGKAFSILNVYNETIATLSLLLLIPLMKNVWKWHESTMTVVFSACLVMGQMATSAARNLWPEFYLARIFPSMSICMYSCLRALFTKMVEPDETGKVFSAIAILVALVPAGFGPMYKKVYNWSITPDIDFPAAFMLLAGALYAVVCLLCVVLWFNRKQMTVGDAKKGEDLALEEKKKEANE